LLKDRSVDDIVKSSPSTVKVETGLTAQRSVVIAEDKAVKLSKGSVEASQRVSTIETDKVVSAMDKPDNRIRGEVVESLKIDNTGLEGNIVGSENEIIASGELIKPDPSAGFDIDIISGCVPLKVSFNNLSMNYDSCIWEFGDGGYSNVREPVWIFDEDGEYNVKLIVFGDDQAASANSTVTVHPLPLAKFEVNSRDPMLPDEQVMFYNYSENSVEWKWEFGDGESSYGYEPAHQYKKYDSYSVKLLAISEYGCKDSLIITNAFGVNSCYLKFPNAFIPNDGGPTGGYYSSRTDIESEVFHPVWSGVTEYNLKIFSRTGIMIFESNDINIGWDGYNRGQKVEPGVYIWKVRGVFKNGDPFVQKGDITLVPKR
jgi:PKD repeat protein